MKKIILTTIFFSSICTAQFYLIEDFDQYISGQQLVCQNPIEWFTWSNTPCEPWEDPYLSSTHSRSYPNSLKIEYHNNLIKLLGNQSTGRNHITVYAYIPSGKSGKLSLYSKFNPDPNELAFECYFDVDGTGRLINIPGAPVEFNYTTNQWHLVWVVVDLDNDEAQFYLDSYFIHTWNWTQNGTIASQLAAHNFSGLNTTDEIYYDDYNLFDNYSCLWCPAPATPTNLTVQQIFNTEPLVQLHWQHSYLWDPRAFEIIKKKGSPVDPTEFQHLDYVPFTALQYLDSNIVIDSTYTYGVIAMNMYGYSDTSNFATITVEPVTSIEPINSSLEFSLSPNYPNPFNPSTKIKYQIPLSPPLLKGESEAGGFVTLKVYDVLGNEVATLVNEEKPVGEYEVEFNAKELPSGIYLYQLKAGSFIQTKKMVLLR